MKRQFKFTKKALDALAADAQVREVEWADTDVAGLRIVVNRLGRKSWLLRFTMGGVKCAMKLGDYPAVDIAEARLKAIEARASAARGVDPRATAIVSVADKPLTLTQFMEESYLVHAKATLRSYRDLYGRWRHHIQPVFGGTALVDLRTQDIQRFHDQKRAELSPATANRLLALMKRALGLSITWSVGGLHRNPTQGIRMHPEHNQRQAYLSGERLQRFMVALDAEPSRTAAALIKFLIATGVRRGEALTARFSDMNLDDATWRLTRTKNGRSRVVYLSDVSLAIVKSQREVARHDWVFPAAGGKNAHLGDPKKAFHRVLRAANLHGEGLVLHSLRHSFATLVAEHYPLQVAGHLLGHRNQATTAIYAHAQSGQLREAVARVSSTISAAGR